MSAPVPVRPPPSPALIPLTRLDAPTQRLYAASALVALQALKVYLLVAQPTAPLVTSLLLSLGFLFALARLRIPRLDYARTRWQLLFLLFAASDWLLCGGWRSLPSLLASAPVIGPLGAQVGNIGGALNPWAGELTLGGPRVQVRKLVAPHERILGQYTIHILPYSTATLTHDRSRPACHCISPRAPRVSIPVLFNNTEPALLQYSVTSFSGDDVQLFNVSIPRSALTRIGEAQQPQEGRKELDLVLDDVQSALVRSAEAPGQPAKRLNLPAAGGKQHLFQLPVDHVGRVRLERVLDAKNHDARLDRGEVIVVECPSSTFIPRSRSAKASEAVASKRAGALVRSADSKARKAETEHLCPDEQAELHVRVHGLAPLELAYARVWTPSTGTASDERRVVRGSGAKSASPLKGGVPEVQRIARINSPHATSPLDSSSAGVPTAERLSAALSRASKIGDHSWAEARDIDIPLTLETRRAGTYSYELQSVVDACGNQVDAAALAHAVKGQPAPMPKHEVVVHARARIAFQGCSSEQPKKLLRGETNGEMTLRADGEGAADDGWSALVRFEPTWVGSEKPITRAAQNVSMGAGGIAKVPIEGPGEYIIEAVQGTYCAGEVSTPRVCRVIDVPQPRANITFHAIQDQCAGPVGARALAVLSGTPPFKLEYSEQRKGQPEYARERVVQGTRDEIELRPNSDGDITYRFKRLSDANYKQLALDGPEFTQSVHPLATARFAGSTSATSRVPGQPHRRPGGVAGRQPARTIVLRSCDGNRAAVDVEFSGVGPFALTYATRVADDAAPEQKVLEGLTGKSHTLDLDLPERLSTQGGLMTLSLVSIRDSRGCERPLAEADVVIEVRRTKPSAGFDVPSGQPRGQINVLEGQDARLPVRLTGEGPWQVEVQRQGDDGPPITETLRSADAHILARKAGRYTLLSVKDSTCSGSIVPGQDEFDVTLIPRPSARFDDSAGHLAANSSLLRAAVCVGRPDSVDVRLTGHSPLSLSYALSLDGRSSQSTISSAQGEATLPLSTTSAGWHTYELVNIGDQLYAPAHLPRGAAASSHAVLHQMVYPAPVASFVETRSAASLCVGDSLSSAKIGSSVPTISLVGTPPFAVDFSVGEATESISRRRVFHREDVQSHSLVVELSPQELSLDRVGRWTVRVERVVDGNGCETAFGAPDAKAPEWDAMVVETAGIVAVGTRSDFCVGEEVAFALQGTAPWTVEYTFAGKHARTKATTPTFSRLADRAGDLSIRSVAHERNRCVRNVEGEPGMLKRVHALPRISIRQGNHYIQDLPEGNQAEIVFHLEGEPPFSFTYSRTEPTDRHSRPRVLETHTIAGINEHEWSLTTSQEGTWTVSWLQDKWCTVSVATDATGTTTQRKLLGQ